MTTPIDLRIQAFFAQFPKKTFAKGELLLRSGDTPSGVLYLQSGLVKMYALSPQGEEVVLNLFKPTAFFPLSWAINDTANLYFFEAVADVEIHCAPKAELLAYLNTSPDVTLDVLKRVFRGMDGQLLKMTQLMSGSAYIRLITELIIMAKRFQLPQPHGLEISIKLKEKDLASQTGMSRETISRELKILKDKGFVSFSKETLTIFDVSKLEAEIEAFS